MKVDIEPIAPLMTEILVLTKALRLLYKKHDIMIGINDAST